MSATANSYITLNGLKVMVLKWHPTKPTGASGVGVGGDAWLSRGAESLKWQWDFIARVQYTPAATYAALADLQMLATTNAGGYITLIDVYGSTWAAQWESAWLWDADTNESAGTAEWYEIKARLRQK